MSDSPTRLVQALIMAGSKERVSKLNDEVPKGPVVTISRGYGAGGHSVGEKLAKYLGVRCFDRELLDKVVEKSKVDRYLMEELDEKVRGSMSDWVYSLLTGKSVFSEDYRRHLMSVVVAIAQHGGVIVGRGAHFILSEQPNVLRVRLVASEEVCVKRIMERDKLPKREALKRIHETDRDREIYLYALYKTRGNGDTDFDLILNSGKLDYAQITEVIVATLKARGLLQE